MCAWESPHLPYLKKVYKKTARDKRFNEEMYEFASKYIMFEAATHRLVNHNNNVQNIA